MDPRETETESPSRCAAGAGKPQARGDEMLTIGERLSGRYRIERVLGEGGMGVVYLASDEQVVGEVFAIKVLKEEPQPEALRFLREEVHKTRKLSHPNIVDVHSVNVDGTKLYVLMECLEGRSLQALLDEEFGRGMAFSHAWPIIEDVGAALGHAHDHNIIHSDLKPANVFVTTSGRTKLLDFGIARVSRGPLLHARSGPLALTPAYASCEMLEGKEADRRDDIYSFACLIYEMLSGKRPFGERTALEAREAGIPPASLEPLSRAQNAALAKALAFDRERRTSSAEELLEELAADSKRSARPFAVLGAVVMTAVAAFGLAYFALDRLLASRHSVVVQSVPAVTQQVHDRVNTIPFNPPPHSIAVLPFVNISGDQEQEYFSDGLTEELLNALARINELQVAARTSSFVFKNKPEDISVIGRELRVAHVLEGSVRKAGNHLRITAQLIRTDSGYHLWSETYDRTLDDIFKLQDQITAAVVQALKLKLLAASLTERAAPAPTSLQAYNLYLQGRFFAGAHTKEGYRQAIDYLERALKLDEAYEPSWTALSIVYVDMMRRGFMPANEALPRARDAVQRALSLNSRSARAHVALGYIHMDDDWNWTAADHDIGEALALEPGSADVLHAAGSLDLTLGRVSESVRTFLAALARDPLRASSYSNLGVAYFADGRLDEAEQAFRKSIELRPGAGYTHNGLGLVLLWRGHLAAALEQMRGETDETWRLEGLALVYWAMHRREESDAALAALKAKFKKESPYVIATVYGYRGAADEAFAWLDRALAARDATLTSIKADPLFKMLRTDPRYAALLQRVGLPL